MHDLSVLGEDGSETVALGEAAGDAVYLSGNETLGDTWTDE